MSQDEILNQAYQESITGLQSIHTPKFPLAYTKAALLAMERYAAAIASRLTQTEWKYPSEELPEEGQYVVFYWVSPDDKPHSEVGYGTPDSNPDHPFRSGVFAYPSRIVKCWTPVQIPTPPVEKPTV